MCLVIRTEYIGAKCSIFTSLVSLALSVKKANQLVKLGQKQWMEEQHDNREGKLT